MNEPKICIEKHGDEISVETLGTDNAITTLLVVAMRREPVLKKILLKALKTVNRLVYKPWRKTTQKFPREMAS